jgi:hypothetical protein
MAEMPYKLLSSTDVGPAAKVVYLALRHAAVRKDSKLPEGGYPAIAIDRTYLLEDTGLGRETFRPALAELETRGWIAVIRPNKDGATVTIDGKEYTARAEREGVAASTYILLAG